MLLFSSGIFACLCARGSGRRLSFLTLSLSGSGRGCSSRRSPCFYFREQILGNWHHFSLKCLVESPVKPLDPGGFLSRKWPHGEMKLPASKEPFWVTRGGGGSLQSQQSWGQAVGEREGATGAPAGGELSTPRRNLRRNQQIPVRWAVGPPVSFLCREQPRTSCLGAVVRPAALHPDL